MTATRASRALVIELILTLGDADSLREAGADLVVDDLAELLR